MRIEDRLARRGGWIELLRGPAVLYGLVTRARNLLFDRGVLRAQRVDLPVVSVGNLTAGGTGKTPFSIWLARRLMALGRRPAILSRGYGARAESGISDEAELLARALPDTPHLTDRDRVRAARELEGRAVDVVILDDGFQHRRLARDLDIVLIDATRPFGFAPDERGRWLRAHLPRGLLREAPRGLARADVICLTRTDQVCAQQLEALRAELFELAPGKAVLETRHRCVAARQHSGVPGPGGWLLSPEALAGREVDLVSGIGHPRAFEATLAATGARIAQHRVFPDHHDFTPEDLEGLGADGRELVTTTKDATKLEAFGRPFWSIEIAIDVVSGDAALTALLEALPEGRAARERRALHEGLHG